MKRTLFPTSPPAEDNESSIRTMINRVYKLPQTRPYAQHLIDNKLNQIRMFERKIKDAYKELDIMRDELAHLEMGAEMDKAELYRK